MKTAHLLASFAVAVTASAADLKDPATVAKEWSDHVAQFQRSTAGDLGLSNQAVMLSPDRVHRAAGDFSAVPRFRGAAMNVAPTLRLYDAPITKAPKNLPNNRPRGAVPWEYNGEVHWRVPSSPSAKE
jgi:hypothetical protein